MNAAGSTSESEQHPKGDRAFETLIKLWELNEQKASQVDERLMRLGVVGLGAYFLCWVYCTFNKDYRYLLLFFPYLQLLCGLLYAAIVHPYAVVGKEGRYIQRRLNDLIGDGIVRHADVSALYFSARWSFHHVCAAFIAVFLFAPLPLSFWTINYRIKELQSQSWLCEVPEYGAFVVRLCTWQAYWAIWLATTAVIGVASAYALWLRPDIAGIDRVLAYDGEGRKNRQTDHHTVTQDQRVE